jgi:hypothetical protein
MHTTQDNLSGESPLKIDRIVGLTAPSLKRPADSSNAPNAKKVKATAQLLSSSM